MNNFSKLLISFLLLFSVAFSFHAGGSDNYPGPLNAGDCLVVFSGMHATSNTVLVSHVRVLAITVNVANVAPGDSFRVTMTVENSSDSSQTISGAALRFYDKRLGTTAPDDPSNYDISAEFTGSNWTGGAIPLAANSTTNIIFNLTAVGGVTRANPVIIDGYLEVGGIREDAWWGDVALNNEYAYASVVTATIDTSGIPFVDFIEVTPNPTKAGLVTITVNFSEIMDTTYPPQIDFQTAGGATVVLNGTALNWINGGLSWWGTAAIPANQSAIYDGAATVRALNATDNIGNNMIASNNVGTFMIDTVTPTMQVTYNFGAMPGIDFNIQVIGSEAISQVPLWLEVECNDMGLVTENYPVIWDSNIGQVTWNGHFSIPLTANVGSIATFNIIGNYYDLAGNINNVNTGEVTAPISETIPVFENIYFDRGLAFNGQTISDRPFVEAYVRHVKAPSGVTLDASSIRVTVDNTLVIAGDSLVQLSSTLFMFDFYMPGSLSIGTHIFEFAIQDSNSNWSRPTTFSVQVVSAGLELSDGPLPLPNPFSPDGDGVNDITYLAYTLTQSTDISLRIYDLNGNLVWRREIDAGQEGAHAGVNKVSWAGIDSYERDLANGIYICYVLRPNNDGLKVLGKTKVFILK